MRIFSTVVFIALASSTAFAQAPGAGSAALQATDTGAVLLATPTGHEVQFSVGGYNYEEPGDLNISIHGPKFGGGYTGTLAINRNRHWFAQLDARGTFGGVTYDGWCSPYRITPDSTSPNGYFLDVGDASPCSESGDRDWYVESRGLIGRDVLARTWGFSPQTGIGVRHLSNGTAGVPGYRTQRYLYLPVGLTARTLVGSRRPFSVNLEYDLLLRGWQHTHDSKFGGGDVPATLTAPAFSIDGFSDLSFQQDDGWALRASAKYQVTRRWSVEPAFVHWNVGASPVDFEMVSFTVNGITAHERFGAFEPDNSTDEFVVRLGFHF